MMLKLVCRVLLASLTVIAMTMAGSTSSAMSAPPLDLETLRAAIPAAQGDDIILMVSAYGWGANGPEQCPADPIFAAGTRVVYHYIPAILNQNVNAIMLWYELDDEGTPISDEPMATGQAVLYANSLPNGSISLGKGTQGLFGGFLFIEDTRADDWILAAVAYFIVAPPGYNAPQPAACPLPDTGTGTTGAQTGDTGESPGGAEVTGSGPLNVSWSPQMTYEGRMGESRWCQMSMTYQNNGGQSYDWPAYRPVFLIVNGDGSQDGWYYGGYYAKEDGWENGIEGTPPSMPGGTSADWTWYSATDRAGQYCAAVGVAFQDWVYVAVYDAQGALIETGAYPPQ